MNLTLTILFYYKRLNNCLNVPGKWLKLTTSVLLHCVGVRSECFHLPRLILNKAICSIILNYVKAHLYIVLVACHYLTTYRNSVTVCTYLCFVLYTYDTSR